MDNSNYKRTSDISFSQEAPPKKLKAKDETKVPNIQSRNQGGNNISQEEEPTKVVFVRNLPSDCTEQELVGIACPFGVVVSVLMLKAKNQAFIQMQDKNAAQSLIKYYTSVQPNIRSRPIYFQFSNRDEITTTSPSSSESPNNILLVTVHNVIYPVTIETLHQIFSKYGNLQKCVIFHNKNGLFQTLLQFSSISEASAAKQALDGQNIYTGCCSLKIQFSSMNSLTVKVNNDKTRDFTNPNLPSSDAATDQTPSSSQPLSTNQTLTWPPSMLPNLMTSNLGLTNFGVGVPVTNLSSMYPPTNPSSIPLNILGTLSSLLNPALPTGVTMPLYQTLNNNNVIQNDNNVSTASESGSQSGTVLIVSNLEPKFVTPDVLFILFGVYGDVQRVKILFGKPDTALVQLATEQQSKLALENLNGCPLFGKEIMVNQSHHNTISLPRESDGEASKLTKDYTGSNLHRYRLAGSKNFQHICPPSIMLHVSNISQTASETQLREIFSRYGTIKNFKFFSKDKRMALIELGSIDESVTTLVNLHDYRLGETNLRVSFSKNKIK